MGDDCCNEESMGRIKQLIHTHLPETFVYSIRVGDTIDDDHKSGFFGRIHEQVDKVCDEIAAVPELKDGFNAIGFSQVNCFKRRSPTFCLFCFIIGWLVFKVQTMSMLSMNIDG